MFNALLFSPISDRLNMMKTSALDSEGILLLRILDEYPAGNNLNRLLNHTEPDLVLLDLSDPGPSLACADAIRAWRDDVVIIGFTDSAASQIPPHRAHALLPLSVPPAHLLQTVQQEALRLSIRVNENLYAFMPGKAGSGSSTLIWHTAVILAQSKRVMLIESDLRSGALSHMLNLEPDCSLQDLLRGDLDRNSFLLGRDVATSMGVDLLLSDRSTPSTPPLWQDYFGLINSLASRYDVILIDVPETPDPATRQVLRLCGTIYLVTTPDVVSVQLTRRTLTEIPQWGIHPDRTRVLLNRWEQGELDAHHLQSIFAVPVVAAIPSDYRTIRASLLNSSPLKPETGLARSLADFASRSIKAPAPLAPPKDHSLGGKFKFLFQSSAR
jgi:Mrp family chromosome partitioning ATPase